MGKLILLAMTKSTAPIHSQACSATGFSRPVTLLSIYLGSLACTEAQSCHTPNWINAILHLPALTAISCLTEVQTVFQES